MELHVSQLIAGILSIFSGLQLLVNSYNWWNYVVSTFAIFVGIVVLLISVSAIFAF